MRRTFASVLGGLALVAAMALPAAAAPNPGRHGWPGAPGMHPHHPHPGPVAPGPGDRYDRRHPGGYVPMPGPHGPHHRGPRPPSCPDRGFYDRDGHYWYWNPAEDEYVMCP